MSLRPSTFDEALKLVGALGALLSFAWGVWVWRDQSIRQLRQQQSENLRLAESRRIEATKPFLERQLKLYTEATQVAGVLATSSDANAIAKATERFWQLYWGELALVENREVEGAMVAFRDSLLASASQSELQNRSLDRSWGIRAWTNPDQAAEKADAAPESP